MRRGDFAAAWVVSDQVLRARDGRRDWSAPRHLQAVWDGTPLDGRRVLVRCWHGLGDTLQFVRFVPTLRERAAEVTTWAQPALLPLLRTVPGIGPLLPLHDGDPGVAYDVDVEVMELAHALRATPDALARPVPYLHVPPAALRRTTPDALAVGLVWECGDWGRERAMTIDDCRPLLDVEGVALHLLQRGPALAGCPPGFGVPSGADDPYEAARVVRALDLVLTVDTMPAHLAGALGVPVWVMLPTPGDWRWMDDREDSPWYPTMRLFRQARDRPGDWAPVVARVCAELRRLVAERRRQVAAD